MLDQNVPYVEESVQYQAGHLVAFKNMDTFAAASLVS